MAHKNRFHLVPKIIGKVSIRLKWNPVDNTKCFIILFLIKRLDYFTIYQFNLQFRAAKFEDSAADRVSEL